MVLHEKTYFRSVLMSFSRFAVILFNFWNYMQDNHVI